VKPFVNAFATKAAPKVPMIRVLLDITLVSREFKAPDKSPLNAVCIALAAPLDWARLRAVPSSIADILKTFFLDDRRVFRLGAIMD